MPSARIRLRRPRKLGNGQVRSGATGERWGDPLDRGAAEPDESGDTTMTMWDEVPQE